MNQKTKPENLLAAFCLAVLGNGGTSVGCIGKVLKGGNHVNL